MPCPHALDATSSPAGWASASGFPAGHARNAGSENEQVTPGTDRKRKRLTIWPPRQPSHQNDASDIGLAARHVAHCVRTHEVVSPENGPKKGPSCKVNDPMCTSVHNVHTPLAGQKATFPLPRDERKKRDTAKKDSGNYAKVMSSTQPVTMKELWPTPATMTSQKGRTDSPRSQ